MRSPRRIAVALGLIALAGCSGSGLLEISAERLFSLSLGRLEDQVDLFQPLTGRNRIHMRDGIFYVANGSAGKIMVLSSYGELLELLYNPSTNPPPVLMGQPAGGEDVSTRGAFAYPFQDIGEIAVSNEKTLYVEDAAPAAKVVKDDDVLSRVVLRFDRKGVPQGYLGQEGVGGTPFPFIAGMYVTQRDQLVVVCRRTSAWEAFWFAREGELQYQVRIDSAHLPTPPSKGLTASLVSLMPDQTDPVLYLLLYYFPAAAEASAKSTTPEVIVRIQPFDLSTRRYRDPVEVPANPSRREKVGFKTEEIARPPYDLLGVGPGGQLYLIGYADTNLYSLVVLGLDGRTKGRGLAVIEDTELTFRDTHLSAEGILYGLLCDREQAFVSWWRTDHLVKREGR